MKRGLIVAVLIVLGTTMRASGDERTIRFDCRGFEAYEITGTLDVDWVWGNIRAKDRSVVVGFSMGPMVRALVPTERPRGFRSFHVERIKKVRLSHGHNVPQNQYQITLLGAPIDDVVNLVGPPRDQTRLLAIARALAEAPCRVTVQRAPSK